MTVRSAVPEDIGSIARLGDIPELTWNGERTLDAEDYRAHMPCDYFLVAEEKGVVIGFLMGEPLMNHGVALWTMAVAPDRRGEGVGSALLEEAETRARALGAHWFYGPMTLRDPGLRDFYERHGFTFGQQVLEMTKLLGPRT